MIACDWADVNEATRRMFPASVAFHQAHGADLTRCDAWRCVCGNSPHGEGFDPEPCLCGATIQGHHCDAGGERYRCARCSRLYDPAGREVTS